MKRRGDHIQALGDGRFRCRRSDGAASTFATYGEAVSWLLGRPADRPPTRTQRMESALAMAAAALDGREDRGRALAAIAEALEKR